MRARELLVVQSLDEVPAELSLTPEADDALRAQAARVEHAVVVRLLELLGEAMEGVRAGADPATRLELALVKAAKPEVDGSTRALLARIERLEEGGPAAAQTVPGRPAPDLGASVERAIAAEGHRAEMAGEAPVPPEPAQAPAPTPTPESVAVTDVESIIDLWPAVVELVGAEHALCGAVITDARPVSVSGNDLMVGFPTTAAFLKEAGRGSGQSADRDRRTAPDHGRALAPVL